MDPVWTYVLRLITGRRKFLEAKRLRDGRVRELCISSEYLVTDPQCNTFKR